MREVWKKQFRTSVSKREPLTCSVCLKPPGNAWQMRSGWSGTSPGDGGQRARWAAALPETMARQDTELLQGEAACWAALTPSAGTEEEGAASKATLDAVGSPRCQSCSCSEVGLLVQRVYLVCR